MLSSITIRQRVTGKSGSSARPSRIGNSSAIWKSSDGAALVGNWNYPTAIRFGAGRIRELPEACKAVGLKRPLLVTDPGLAKLPMIADAMLALRKAGLEVALFSDVRPNPIARNVESGVPRAARRQA